MELEKNGVLLVQDGNHGASRPTKDEIGDFEVPHIRAADISDDGVIDWSGAQRISDSAYDRIKKGRGLPGDVLFTHKGTVGRVARVPHDAPRFLCAPQTTFWRSLDHTRLDQGYLHSFLRSPLFLRQVHTRMHDTDMAPYVSLTAQRSFLIALPPIAEQRRIADVLHALDSKASVNQRLAAEVWDLASLRFEQTFGTRWLARFHSGRVPRGGRWGTLSDVVELRYGKALKAAARNGGPVAVVGSSGVVGAHSEPLVDAPAVVVGRKGNAGSVLWIDRPAWPIDTTFFVVPRQGVSREYAHWALLSANLTDLATGAGSPGVARDAIYRRPAVVPGSVEQQEFAADARKLLRARYGWLEERRTLLAIRETLLPRLVSGQVRVSPTADDAETVETVLEDTETLLEGKVEVAT